MGSDLHYAMQDAKDSTYPRLCKALRSIAEALKLPLDVADKTGPSGYRQDHLDAIVKSVQDKCDQLDGIKNNFDDYKWD